MSEDDRHTLIGCLQVLVDLYELPAAPNWDEEVRRIAEKAETLESPLRAIIEGLPPATPPASDSESPRG